MRFTENRKIAWCVLAVSIIISVFVLGGSSLARERSQVIRLFDEGSDTSLSVRHSMDAYLDASADAAEIMALEAERYIPENPVIEDVRTLAGQIVDGDDIGGRFDAYTALKSKVDKLYNDLCDRVDVDSFVSFKIAYDDFWGYEDMISRDEYHKAARDYNKASGGFPGSLISKIMGLSELNTFGG